MGKKGSRARYVLGHFGQSKKGRYRSLRQRRDVLGRNCSCEECSSRVQPKSSIEVLCDIHEEALKKLSGE